MAAKRIVPQNAVLLPDTASKVFSGKIFDVYQWPQTLFDGSTSTFEMLKRPDTVIMLVIKDDKIVFIREQQPGRPEYTRLAGGRVDPGEDWETAVTRECAEELGLTFRTWRLVHVHQPIAKIEWFVATYLALDCTGEQEAHLDAGEKISTVPMDFDEAKAYVMSLGDPLTDYTQHLFATAQSLDDLKNLAAFEGQEVS